ncbi:hyphally regulated cell wall protein 3 isoform X2 [Drosophila elegans]|uniref:hyphally regulated cell wall protein 3 isoform X2 n=1 Tax=Drosophila elegans TaxID=30023 RepID=UPI0007E872FB|nr:hyphally regulated cell wall protein 3 isoform X2 [Drosophila elegans]
MMTMTATSASISTSASASAAASIANSASTDCSSSMQGSSTSSASSDVMTLTTTAASSWCAIPSSCRLRVLRLVRPHQRRLLVGGPERGSTYGFAVRGGREHGTGFFVSHVEHGGEAQLKGLRIGDQILRINGFRLDDAVHKEFIQLVAGQDRVTLKVRGVGMLPVRDQAEERLSWSVVKLPSVSGTPSESSFKGERRVGTSASRDISVVLHVAPRTKLGLGICKGPEWKPGIFVQFTKERSVAREAGLRPGDQILSVNSIDFSDVLFSEAVAVMKSSSKLDMVVRTAAGCDLFPGESSGYNSSASSVTGDQSPCWADAKSKRLTAVREESGGGSNSGSGTAGTNWSPGVEVHKQMNKTIIKLTENGTSINNTYIASSGGSSGSGSGSSASGTSGRSQHSQSHTHSNPSRHSTTMKRSHLRPVNTSTSAVGLAGGSGSGSGAGAAAIAVPAPPPPAIGEGVSAGGSVGSSLSSAITEELKKRKEKQQQQQQQQQRNNRDRDRDRDGNGNGNVDRQLAGHNERGVGNGNGNGSGGHRNAGGQVSHRQRASVAGVAATLQGSERISNSVGGGGGGGGGAGASNGAGGDQHTALMDEFKRAHQRMFRNGFHESEHKLSSLGKSPLGNRSHFGGRKMSLLRVKNGGGGDGEGSGVMPTMRPVSMGRPLVTMSTYQERGETLKRTSIMPDESCYRNSINSNGFGSNRSNSNGSNTSNSNGSNTSNSNTSNNSRLQPPNGINPANGNGSPELPPPPPQFANPQPKQQLKLITGSAAANGSGNGSGIGPNNELGNGSLAKVKQPMSPMRSASISVGGFRPPATPQPDYDAVQLRSPPGTGTGSGSGSTTSQQQRRTLRLGTVTIGEYGDQRTTGKRETLRKTNGEAGGSNGILKNGSNRSSASFNHGSAHQPEKSIKFGN